MRDRWRNGGRGRLVRRTARLARPRGQPAPREPRRAESLAEPAREQARETRRRQQFARRGGAAGAGVAGAGRFRDRRRRGRGRKLDFQFGRPFGVRSRAHESDAGQPALHPPVIGLQDLPIDPEFDAEHQFGALVLRLDGLGGELRFGRDKAHFRRNDVVGDRVEDDAGFVPDSKPAGLSRRKENDHMEVSEIENGDDRFACRNGLPFSRQFILDLSVPRGHEREILDHRV